MHFDVRSSYHLSNVPPFVSGLSHVSGFQDCYHHFRAIVSALRSVHLALSIFCHFSSILFLSTPSRFVVVSDCSVKRILWQWIPTKQYEKWLLFFSLQQNNLQPKIVYVHYFLGKSLYFILYEKFVRSFCLCRNFLAVTADSLIFYIIVIIN